MHFDTSPAGMTIDERRREIAAILARGILRLRKRRQFTPDATFRELSESVPQGLELSGETRLSVTTG